MARIRSIVPNADSVGDDALPMEEEVVVVVGIGPAAKEGDKHRQMTMSFVNVVVVDQDCHPHPHRHCSNLRRCQIHLGIHRRPTTDRRVIPAVME